MGLTSRFGSQSKLTSETVTVGNVQLKQFLKLRQGIACLKGAVATAPGLSSVAQGVAATHRSTHGRTGSSVETPPLLALGRVDAIAAYFVCPSTAGLRVADCAVKHARTTT